MSNLVSALLTQKPDSPAPTPGETRNFTIEQRPKRDGSGTWSKAKNEREGFGSPYKIVKVDRKDDYTHPQHGTFAQFSVLLEPSTGEDAGAVSAPGAVVPPGVGGTASAASKDDQIDRAVAFKGAVEIVSGLVRSGKLSIENAVPEIRKQTDLLLPVVKGEGPTQAARNEEVVRAIQEDKAATTAQPSIPTQAGTNATLDDDIPFAPSRI